MRLRILNLLGAVAVVTAFAAENAMADKSVLLVAGVPSHGRGEHEFRSGCLLLADCINALPGWHASVASNGWPADVAVFSTVDAVVFYADGGDGHPAIIRDRLRLIDNLAAKGVGVGAMHYAVEVPSGEPGLAMVRWTGGYFETFWSVNPTWTASFTQYPAHPVARGLKPFSIHDEWYHHMKFAPGMVGVTPIFSSVPPKNTVSDHDDPHGGNPWARAAVAHGEPQALLWTWDRPAGGRGFGFTGGHYAENWEDRNFRKAVLNAIVWIANGDIPPNGVEAPFTLGASRLNWDAK
jgi:Trehalose utilisation